jgi:hypothetical protein
MYAQPLKILANTQFENIIWTLAVTMISGVLTYSSYQASLGILFFPMLAVFCLSIFSIMIDIFFAVKERISKSNIEK